MQQQYLDQASHNQKFHDCIEGQFANDFFDWKITVLFYVAIHWLKALGIKRGYNLGETHYEIECKVNPGRDNAQCKITRNAWREYKSLYTYSRTARYEGITDINTFQQLKEIDHRYCIEHIERFKRYIKGQGIEI